MKDEGSGGKRGWPYRHLLPPADAQALRDFSLGFQEGRTGTRPYQKLDTRYQIPDQNENSSSLLTRGDQTPTLGLG